MRTRNRVLGTFAIAAVLTLVSAASALAETPCRYPAQRQYGGQKYYITGYQWYCPVAPAPTCMLVACEKGAPCPKKTRCQTSEPQP